MTNRWGNNGKSERLYFWGLQNGDCSHKIKRRLFLGRKAMTNLEIMLKSPRHYFANKGVFSQTMFFSSSPVWM